MKQLGRSVKTKNLPFIIAESQRLSAEFRPEIFGVVISGLNNNNNSHNLGGKLFKHWSPLFSMNKKQCFLKAALRKEGPLDMVDLFLSIGYHKFDVALVIQPRRNNDAGRKCLRKLEEDAKALRDQATTWLNFKQTDVINILEQSPFLGKATIAAYSTRFCCNALDAFLKLLCATHCLKLPASIFCPSFPLNMGHLVNAWIKEEMSDGDVIDYVRPIYQAEPELKELALLAAMAKPKLQELIELAASSTTATATKEPSCWRKKREIRGHSTRYSIQIIGEDISIEDATAILNRNRKSAAVAFRLLNNPRYCPYLAAVAWQFPGDE